MNTDVWKQLHRPMFSLVTHTDKPNMNICAYVSKVSKNPPKMIISLDNKSKTLENVRKNGTVLLQLLAKDQVSVIEILGRQSGRDTDKLAGLDLEEYKGLPYLKGALMIWHLEVEQLIDLGGDHTMAIAKILAQEQLAEGEPMYLSYLYEQGIVD